MTGRMLNQARHVAIEWLTAAAVVVAAEGLAFLLRPLIVAGPAVAEALPLDELSRRASVSAPTFIVVWFAAGGVLAALGARVAASIPVLLACYALTVTSVSVVRQVSLANGLLAALAMPAVYGAAVCALVGLWVIPRRSRRLRPA